MESRKTIWAAMLAGIFFSSVSRAQTPLSFMIDDPTAEEGGRFGKDVHIVDLNGDGVGELLIGAPGKIVSGYPLAGLLYIKVGPIESITSSLLTITEPSVPGQPSGPRANDRFGFRIVSGDFNNDGNVDVAVSAPGVNLDQPGVPVWEQGAVYILYGPWDLAHSPYYSTITPPIVIFEDPAQRLNDPNYQGAGDHFGWRIAAGDPNQDGYDDLVIGSPTSVTIAGSGQFLHGQAYLYHGPGFDYQSATQLLLSGPGTPPLNDREWGQDVAIGNLTGLSAPEIIVGAFNSDNNGGQNNGWIRVFRDDDVLSVIDITRPGGDLAQADFGWAINVGEYDTDNYLDMIVGMPYETQQNQKGEVWIFPGGPSFPGNAISFTRPFNNSYQLMDRFGDDVEFLDDQHFTPDGKSEIVTGASYFYRPSSPTGIHYGPGRVFIRDSNNPGSQSNYLDDPSPEEIPGSNEWDGWGSSLSTGMFDNNTVLDIAIGDPRATKESPVTHTQVHNAGEVRVSIYN